MKIIRCLFILFSFFLLVQSFVAETHSVVHALEAFQAPTNVSLSLAENHSCTLCDFLSFSHFKDLILYSVFVLLFFAFKNDFSYRFRYYRINRYFYEARAPPVFLVIF